MELFLFNLKWMIFNCFLAIIPVFLGRQVFKKKFTFLKFIGVVFWFFFLPNTIYLLTDSVNLFYDVNFISGAYLLADILMYIVLIPVGITTFVLAVEPFEKMFPDKLLIFVLNLFVGFGVVLGRVQRVNSWEILTNTEIVVTKSIEIIRSLELMTLVFVFAILSQAIYIQFKKPLLKVVR